MIFSISILIPNAVSGKLNCADCPTGSCPPPGMGIERINIFNLSEEGMVWTSNSLPLPGGKEIWCNGSGLTLGTSAGIPILRISDLTDGHAQKTDYPGSSYAYNINLSSTDAQIQIQCGYYDSGCVSNGYDSCIISMEAETNSHVADCTKYTSKLCCNATNITTQAPPVDTEIIKLTDHKIFITIGETYHLNVQVRNMNPKPDVITLRLDGPGGTYPPGLVKFLDSSTLTTSVSLRPYEERAVYAEILSTGVGDYIVNVTAASQTYGDLTGSGTLDINIGFPASFPGLEAASILMLILLSLAIYWKML